MNCAEISRSKAPVSIAVYNDSPHCTGMPMTTIDELTDELLLDRGAVKWLKLADGYIQMYNREPAMFLLPREHAKLKPLIEIYAHDLHGFVRYILGVRDSFHHDTPAYADLHKLYRTVSTRLLQQERRERINRAVDRALSLRGKPASTETRMAYARLIEQLWARRRLDYLTAHRATTKQNRLSADERGELLAEFWAVIENEIERGTLPPMKGE